jgi:hypothetical protein
MFDNQWNYPPLNTSAGSNSTRTIITNFHAWGVEHVRQLLVEVAALEFILQPEAMLWVHYAHKVWITDDYWPRDLKFFFYDTASATTKVQELHIDYHQNNNDPLEPNELDGLGVLQFGSMFSVFVGVTDGVRLGLSTAGATVTYNAGDIVAMVGNNPHCGYDYKEYDGGRIYFAFCASLAMLEKSHNSPVFLSQVEEALLKRDSTQQPIREGARVVIDKEVTGKGKKRKR